MSTDTIIVVSIGTQGEGENALDVVVFNSAPGTPEWFKRLSVAIPKAQNEFKTGDVYEITFRKVS